jgi:hypothetical protein
VPCMSSSTCSLKFILTSLQRKGRAIPVFSDYTGGSPFWVTLTQQNAPAVEQARLFLHKAGLEKRGIN